MNPSSWQPFPIPPDITPYGFYAGTSGYYYDDWIGIFNPPRISAKKIQELPQQEQENRDRLLFYQNYFSFIEINNTFYTPPTLEHFSDLERRSKPRTLYTVKAHKDISHTRSWDSTTGRELMKQHIIAVSPLIETGRLFSLLIQLEDHVFRSQERLDYLLAVSHEAVKRRVDVHIEFRHNSWHMENVLRSLKNSGVGICNTEIPPVEHAFPLKSYATNDKGYIRYSGRNLENWYPKTKAGTSKERLSARNARYDYNYSNNEIEERVKGQIKLSQKTRAVAVVYNNHYKSQAVQNALYNIMLLKTRYK